MGSAGALFASYVFNLGGLQTFLDDYFSNLDHQVHLHDKAVGSEFLVVLPYVGLFVVGIGLLYLFSFLGKGARTVQKERRLKDRDQLSMSEFVELAREHGVGVKVARESYRLLLPHYRNRMRALFTDSLSRDLKLSPPEIRDLHGNMLRMADRQHDVFTAGSIDTILQMMQAVERCEDRSLTPSKLRRRAEEKAQGIAAASSVRPVAPAARIAAAVRARRTSDQIRAAASAPRRASLTSSSATPAYAPKVKAASLPAALTAVACPPARLMSSLIRPARLPQPPAGPGTAANRQTASG